MSTLSESKDDDISISKIDDHYIENTKISKTIKVYSDQQRYIKDDDFIKITW